MRINRIFDMKDAITIKKLLFLYPLLIMLISYLIMAFAVFFVFHEYFQKEKQSVKREFFNNLKKVTKQRVITAKNVLEKIYALELENEKEKLNTIVKVLAEGKNAKFNNITIKISKEPLNLDSEKNIYSYINKNGVYYYAIESKKSIIKKIKTLVPKIFDSFRWGKKGYVFVHDSKGVCYYHINKSLIGKNRWNLKRDGIFVLQKLTHEALKHPKGTYVSYKAYNPEGNKPIEKISFILYDKKLDLTIGSGVYLNDLKTSLNKIEKEKKELIHDLLMRLVIILLFSIFIMGVVLVIITRRIIHSFEKYNKTIFTLELEQKKKECEDEVTGLLKDKCLAKKFNEIKNNNLAVMVVDINSFREINELFDRETGNEILRIFAQKLKKSLKATDLIGKGKIDEFIILLQYKNKSDVNKIARRIYEKLHTTLTLSNGKEYVPSVRIGVSFNKDDGNEFFDLMQKASLSAVEVKNKYVRIGFYDKNLDKKMIEYLELKNDLANAIKKKKFKQFEIYYQPQIDKNEKLAGMEALIRWNHPQKGLISPGKFLPIAINEGYIRDLDIMVMDKVIKQINKWLNKGYNPGVVSCNVTMKTLESKDYMEIFKKKIKKVNVNYFGIEITEESVTKSNDVVKKILNEINDLGVSISLDDFGTGYSNLTKLKELPISKLKIDKSFIDGIPDNESDVKLTEIVINVGKILNLKLVAEGVENEVQKDFVIKRGVDYIQGYYYSKPLPSDAIEKKYFKTIS